MSVFYLIDTSISKHVDIFIVIGFRVLITNDGLIGGRSYVQILYAYLTSPQAEAHNDKYVHMFRARGVDKIKYGHEGIMINLITATYTDIVI